MRKKFNCLALLLLLLLFCTACSQNVDQTKDKKETSVEKITDSDQIMFEAVEKNWGEVNFAEDYWCSTSYVVYYDGTIQIFDTYNLSGEKNLVETEMTDEDYSYFRNLLENEIIDYEYSTDACDGESWEMNYYDTEGNNIWDYHGYIYDSDLLENEVVGTLQNYNEEN